MQKDDESASTNGSQGPDPATTAVGSFRRVPALSRRELREAEEEKRKLEEETKATPPRKVVGAFRHEPSRVNDRRRPFEA